MLPLDPIDIYDCESIILKNKRNGVSTFSKSYCVSDRAELELFVKRNLGVFKPEIYFRSDGLEFKRKLSFSYIGADGIYDIYSLSFKMSEISKVPALLFFKLSFSIGDNTLYFVSANNFDGYLTYSPNEGNEFKMLVYEGEDNVPLWYSDSVMYHIFVDRFCKGSVKVPVRENAIINDDWYYGLPQYTQKPGEPLANNMFFGGTLYGVAEKLDYLKSIGVGTLYLSPICEAYSNHKYDTGDYSKVDEMFGGDKALDNLIAECEKRDMHIILDGVFNHTGDDSVYFNKYGTYKNKKGAYESMRSTYYGWYTFSQFPDNYESWWGITILPKLNTHNPEVENFLAGENGIVDKYIKKGISGFRLDVADELPDKFLETLRSTVKKANPDGIVIGEVWENASDKCSYGKRRSYFRGKQLDGVMNYPVKNGIVEFVKYGNANCLYDTVCDIYSSYPHRNAISLMNILGTHDTERILTVLSTERYKDIHGDELARLTLSPEEYENGKKRLLCASVLQYTLPGVPSVFYGDEAGVSGGHDPFCRKTFPWGREDKKLTEHYVKLGKLRSYEKALGRGELSLISHKDGMFEFMRTFENEEIAISVNCSDKVRKVTFTDEYKILYGIGETRKENSFYIEPYSFVILKK